MAIQPFLPEQSQTSKHRPSKTWPSRASRLWQAIEGLLHWPEKPLSGFEEPSELLAGVNATPQTYTVPDISTASLVAVTNSFIYR
jgi:hypothetical protein